MGFSWQSVLVSIHPMRSEPAHPHTPHEYGIPQHRDVPDGGFLHRGHGTGPHGPTHNGGAHDHRGGAPGGGHHHADNAWPGPFSPHDGGGGAGEPTDLAPTDHDTMAASDHVSQPVAPPAQDDWSSSQTDWSSSNGFDAIDHFA